MMGVTALTVVVVLFVPFVLAAAIMFVIVVFVTTFAVMFRHSDSMLWVYG